MTDRPTRPLPAALGLLLSLSACGEAAPDQALRVPGGDPEKGRAVLASNLYGCGSCHAIPGVAHARGSVGPPLHGMALRAYVAGRVPNQPGNLVAWIVDPQAIDPLNAMPRTGIGPEEATHVAAYLYTLRDLP